MNERNEDAAFAVEMKETCSYLDSLKNVGMKDNLKNASDEKESEYLNEKVSEEKYPDENCDSNSDDQNLKEGKMVLSVYDELFEANFEPESWLSAEVSDPDEDKALMPADDTKESLSALMKKANFANDGFSSFEGDEAKKDRYSENCDEDTEQISFKIKESSSLTSSGNEAEQNYFPRSLLPSSTDSIPASMPSGVSPFQSDSMFHQSTKQPGFSSAPCTAFPSFCTPSCDSSLSEFIPSDAGCSPSFPKRREHSTTRQVATAPLRRSRSPGQRSKRLQATQSRPSVYSSTASFPHQSYSSRRRCLSSAEVQHICSFDKPSRSAFSPDDPNRVRSSLSSSSSSFAMRSSFASGKGGTRDDSRKFARVTRSLQSSMDGTLKRQCRDEPDWMYSVRESVWKNALRRIISRLNETDSKEEEMEARLQIVRRKEEEEKKLGALLEKEKRAKEEEERKRRRKVMMHHLKLQQKRRMEREKKIKEMKEKEKREIEERLKKEEEERKEIERQQAAKQKREWKQRELNEERHRRRIEREEEEKKKQQLLLEQKRENEAYEKYVCEDKQIRKMLAEKAKREKRLEIEREKRERRKRDEKEEKEKEEKKRLAKEKEWRGREFELKMQRQVELSEKKRKKKRKKTNMRSDNEENLQALKTSQRKTRRIRKGKMDENVIREELDAKSGESANGVCANKQEIEKNEESDKMECFEGDDSINYYGREQPKEIAPADVSEDESQNSKFDALLYAVEEERSKESEGNLKDRKEMEEKEEICFVEQKEQILDVEIEECKSRTESEEFDECCCVNNEDKSKEYEHEKIDSEEKKDDEGEESLMCKQIIEEVDEEQSGKEEVISNFDEKEEGNIAMANEKANDKTGEAELEDISDFIVQQKMIEIGEYVEEEDDEKEEDEKEKKEETSKEMFEQRIEEEQKEELPFEDDMR
ncbi:uncharacterized protein MONOS_686 [Monocercomonoides exilis]|uniref:uncharacterized protein n=1 Tax=Monocercomonoides exilis TaxID=2049356 RepID=UPI00355A4974|nr:hypothetical protein MONOS_686 [Monocercomonoides exilis]|eukprot:MONOS_686.1-p1 / transcript=MONOS_686.1 / gene=MONOS_686 / organism=Monocercomonoides_exilis_PA203 / gene_product=unspecified product / transcript_product=unspecified product / location=Mono_scaffold00011:173088-176090(-) / protein_length=932 / sequence_SO=supercontig / SO=protein_coding / is_pseudo=false